MRLQYKESLYQKLKNIDKYDSNDLTIKDKKDEKLYLEDETESKFYTMEAVTFFDKSNVDDPLNDEFEINYIEQSI